jgi:hypothetical protein
MESRRVRLGDVIDDYCPRCRLIMNHGVVGMVGDEVKKVRCNTCMSEHQFRHGQLPASRRKAQGKLFEEVLKGIAGNAETPAPEPEKPQPQPQSTQRRLYTIHRAIAKNPGKDPKKS